MLDRQAHWQDVYTRKAENEVSWYQATPDVSLALIEAATSPGAAIVDVGGGASRLVDALIGRGYDVTVVDIADAALATAQERLGGQAAAARWVAADVTRWRPERTFDLWHDRAVFHFLTEADDRRAYEAVMAAALPTGGHAVIGTFAADGPERCSGLPVRRYDPQDLAAEFRNHFTPVRDLRHDHVTPGGTVQKFQFTVLRKVA